MNALTPVEVNAVVVMAVVDVSAIRHPAVWNATKVGKKKIISRGPMLLSDKCCSQG